MEFETFEFRVFILLDKFLYQVWRVQSGLLFTLSWRENSWMYTFPNGISTMGNANSLAQDLNSGCCPRFNDDNPYTIRKSLGFRRNPWNLINEFKLIALRIFTWCYICLKMIIMRYLKSCNYLPKNKILSPPKKEDWLYGNTVKPNIQLNYARCIQNVSRLKLYLLRQKWIRMKR